MKNIFLALLFLPFLSTAQKTVPRFENDTLYTTSGFKIYKGLTLYFDKGSGRNGKYRFINIKNPITSKAFANTSMVVEELKDFGISVLYNGYIHILGTLTFKDGSKTYADIHMAFDRAIENSPTLVSELKVPDEYRNKARGNISDEILKLYKQYVDGDLTKEEYEAMKKKILDGK
jgi:hypothetical protein